MMDVRMTTNLVEHGALDTKHSATGFLHHSNCGRKYGIQDDQAQLRQFGLAPSMSRRGNCYDNVSMEDAEDRTGSSAPL